MKQKKKIIILLLIILGVVTFLFIFTLNKKQHIENYEKCLMSIQITSSKEGFKPIRIDVKNDKENALIIRDDLEQPIYIFDNGIYYLEGNIFYKYQSKRTYKDIYNVLKGFTQAKLKPNQINDLLDVLHFSKKTLSDADAELVVENKKIKEFSIAIFDIEGYDKININISFSNLDDDFRIDRSILNGNVTNPGTRRKIEETNKNILEIID